jgi:ABC-type nitrate/sulfonate/bicarbonate transport system ATPase subunit
VSVLIGKNGTGKTQLLLKIIEGLRIQGDTDADQTAQFGPSPSFNRMLVFSSVASDPYPRAIPPWQELDYEYFSMIATLSADRDVLTSALVDCLRDDGKIQFFEGGPFNPRGRLVLLERSMTSLGIWPSIYLPLKIQAEEYDLPSPLVWGGRPFFPLARARTLNEQRRLLLVQAMDWTQSPLIFGSGDQPRNLSSGEFAMFRFAAQAAGSVERGCIFLFDEPETHLHPNFISEFMDVLHTILTATRSVAIIATHSAYIVREVPRQRVRILSIENREVSIDTPRLQTFGASVDNISQFVFGDTNISHRYQGTLQEWLCSLGPDITIESIVESYGGVMNSETLSYVAQLLRDRVQ